MEGGGQRAYLAIDVHLMLCTFEQTQVRHYATVSVNGALKNKTILGAERSNEDA